MIRMLLMVVLVLALGALGAYELGPDAGYVLVNFRGWVLETSLLGLALAGVVGVAGVWALLWLVVGGVRLPAAMQTAFSRRRRDRAQASFEAGLQHLLEGQWKRAEIELVRRAADHPAAQLNYLYAAQAAQQQQAVDRRNHYLQLALAQGGKAERAARITQARLQLAHGEAMTAVQGLNGVCAEDKSNTHAVALLADALAAVGDWEALRTLVISDAAASLRQQASGRALLERAMCERLQDAQREARLDQLKALWEALPREAKGWAAIRTGYVEGLLRLNAQAEALGLIIDTLKKEWDAALATRYGMQALDDAQGQLATVEQWLTRYGEQPALLLAAGRACLRNRLWGKARSYLEAVIREAPSAAAYLELAQLCEQTGHDDDARRFYREGLAAAAD